MYQNDHQAGIERSMSHSQVSCNVAIIGGGPAGSTAGSLLKKYNPDLQVAIFEREVFPRDHIGESLLPPISHILDEMGCWDKIEAANFPIKLGATYRWGKKPELWDFDFVPVDQFKEQPRPGKFEGQRRSTAFQVDRSIYDKILLDHAATLGCEVRQGVKVTAVTHEGDRVKSLTLDSGESVQADHYIDASGNSGILRRALSVECQYHSSLQNIAIWDYWQNAEWAVKIGVGGTRIQVRSLPYGWIWFIPMGPTRTSIGLVIPVSYYKQSGLKPAELYAKALQDEQTVSALLKHAQSEGNLQSTKDWSFIADRHTGENWYLIGECAGFADPILSAGVTMAHIAGQQVACTINEIELGGEATWLKAEFGSRQRHRINTHIRFGDYWYTANEQLKELKEFTSVLAQDSGLNLTPEGAWDWISRGGFIDEESVVGSGGFGLSALKDSKDFLADLSFESPLEKNNVFLLDLVGSTTKEVASFSAGRVRKIPCFVRGERTLPVQGAIELLVRILAHESKMACILDALYKVGQQNSENREFIEGVLTEVMPSLEAMIRDGWVRASYDPKQPLAQLDRKFSGFHPNKDNV
jgi:flavin-dependent dehydrogenase